MRNDRLLLIALHIMDWAGEWHYVHVISQEAELNRRWPEQNEPTPHDIVINLALSTSANLAVVAQISSGPDFHKVQQQTASLHKLMPVPPSHGRIQRIMGGPGCVCIPSHVPTPTKVAKNEQTLVRGDPHSAELAVRAVVPTTTQHDPRAPPMPPSE